MRHGFASGLLLGAASLGLIATTWSAGWESLPQGSELASNLDTRIQEFKAEVRRRASVEMIWGNGTDDNGLMRQGSARVFGGNAPPTDMVGPGQYNSAAGTFGSTALTTTEQGGAVDVGVGRLWNDEDGPDDIAGTVDDHVLNVWDPVGNVWTPINSKDYSGAGTGGVNYIYDGGFEITDGSGSAASTTVPSGWALLGTPPIGYVAPPFLGDQGKGVSLKTTATGVGLEGVRQALPGLKANLEYVFRVMAQDQGFVGGGCTLRVSDGTTTHTAVTQGPFWEPLETVLTTTNVAATVNVDLLSTNDTNVCNWDLATAFEHNTRVMQAGIQVCRKTDTSTAAAYGTLATWDDALVSCTVTPPSPGYMVEVRGQLVATHTTANGAALAGRIRENATTTRAMGISNVAGHVNAVNRFEDTATIPLFYTVVNPTPGTALTFTLEGTATNDGGAHTWERNMGVTDGTDDLSGSTDMATTLEVKLVPTR